MTGTGPFLVYSADVLGIREIRALDLLTRKSVLLGRSAEVYGIPLTNAQGTWLVVQLPEGRFAILRRGSILTDRVFRLGENVAAIATSPDDRWIVVATRDRRGADEEGFVTIALRSLNGSGHRTLTRFRSLSDESGGSLEIFWSSPTSLTVIDDCHCDGGANQTLSHRLTLNRVFEDIGFLHDHNPLEPSPTSDGAFFAFDDIPSVDCFENEHACDNILHTLSLVDLRAKKLTTIAQERDRRFAAVQLSPRGSRIAVGRDSLYEIEIYDVARRALVASSQFFAAAFEPAAWLDETRLIALAYSPDLISDVQTARFLLIDVASEESSIEPTTLVSGTGLRYLGLVR